MLFSALPYFIFLGISLIVFSLQRQSHIRTIFNPATILTFLCMTLFAGLRGKYVGTDTASYVYGFSNFDNEPFAGSFFEIFFDEPGFHLLEVIIHLITDQYWGMLVAIAGICYAIILYVINKHSENRILSLFVYITLGYYLFCFNAARQAIAISIYLLAFPCIVKKQFLKYCIIVIIAAMFHRTVLITLPIYFILKMHYSWKSIALIVASGIIVGLTLPSLIVSASQIDERFLAYNTLKASGGYLLTSFYVLLTAFFIIMRAKIGESLIREYDIFLQMLICGSVIYIVVMLTGAYIEISRFAAYFQISTIFLFAKIFNRYKPLVSGRVMAMICIGCLLYYYVFVTTIAGLIPYTLNQELF